MSFEWQQYLLLAQELAGKPTVLRPGEEARLRSALSRAYYAAFCQARLHVMGVEGSTPLGAADNVHFEVARQLISNAEETHQLIGEHLSTLRRYRNQADYEQVVVNLEGLTRAALAIAEWVLDALDALPDNPLSGISHGTPGTI